MNKTWMPTAVGALDLISGAPITREFVDEIGAEGYAEDCASTVDEAIRLMRL